MVLSFELLGSTRKPYSRSHSAGLRLLQLLKATLVLLQPRYVATSKASWVVSPLPYREGTIACTGGGAVACWGAAVIGWGLACCCGVLLIFAESANTPQGNG